LELKVINCKDNIDLTLKSVRKMPKNFPDSMVDEEHTKLNYMQGQRLGDELARTNVAFLKGLCDSLGGDPTWKLLLKE